MPDRQTAQATQHSLRGWEQLEDPDEVRRVLSEIRGIPPRDVFSCAELYDLAYPGYDGDADFYLERGRRGRVLYLGVGTGRIFSRLARENPDAVGLDSSPEMLELLRRRHPHVRAGQVLLGDAAAAPLGESVFDAVVAPYSFLQVVGEARVPQLLRNVLRALKPGGALLTDTFSPYLIPFRGKGLETNVRLTGTGTKIAIYVLYDHLRQDMTELALVERAGERTVLEMRLHYYFPHELLAAFRHAGFATCTLWGGYHGEAFDPSENEVFVYEAGKPTSAGHGPSTAAGVVLP
jgi:SAM-dependent methyltransferase